MSECRGVIVIAEQKAGKVLPTSYEVLSVARQIAGSLGGDVTAVLLGSSEGRSLAERGADKVWVVESPELASFHDEIYTKVLAHLIREAKPEVVVGAATITGKALFGRLAVRMNSGLAADAIAFQTDAGTRSVTITRSVFAGNAFAQLSVKTKPQLLTIRPKIFPEAKPNGKQGVVIQKEVPRENFSSEAKWLESVIDQGTSVNLTQADVIVSGGRGLRGPENFALIRGLAEVLGGAMGASRAAVDAGWIPYSHQVGQTGKTVNPKLYIACGISGAIQHLAGMQGSKCIVAINKDPDAPIFKVAAYGIVGDLFEVVPALTQKLNKD